MKSSSNQPRAKVPNPTYAQAFARLGEALAKATTPSELSASDKINLLRLRLFGRIAEEVIAAEDAQGL